MESLPRDSLGEWLSSQLDNYLMKCLPPGSLGEWLSSQLDDKLMKYLPPGSLGEWLSSQLDNYLMKCLPPGSLGEWLSSQLLPLTSLESLGPGTAWEEIRSLKQNPSISSDDCLKILNDD